MVASGRIVKRHKRRHRGCVCAETVSLASFANSLSDSLALRRSSTIS
ncbi:MAG: hypothetical protein QOG18_2530 [Microbacteriaceae bacterium]|jgi:hypothetical protein|nr:hypothetical protein [Microbacteriaceae bacterium]